MKGGWAHLRDRVRSSVIWKELKVESLWEESSGLKGFRLLTRIGISYWEDSLVQSQDMLERLHILAVLGTPWDLGVPPEELEKVAWEREVWVSLLRLQLKWPSSSRNFYSSLAWELSVLVWFIVVVVTFTIHAPPHRRQKAGGGHDNKNLSRWQLMN